MTGVVARCHATALVQGRELDSSDRHVRPFGADRDFAGALESAVCAVDRASEDGRHWQVGRDDVAVRSLRRDPDVDVHGEDGSCVAAGALAEHARQHLPNLGPLLLGQVGDQHPWCCCI